MKRKWKIALGVMGIVGLMASMSFAAADGVVQEVKERFFFGGGVTPMEIIAEKAGISLDEWFELRELGMTNQEIIEKYNINLEEIRGEAFQEKYEVIDEKVAEGLITAEEGKILKERMETRNMDFDRGNRGMGFGRGSGRGFGYGGMGCRNLR